MSPNFSKPDLSFIDIKITFQLTKEFFIYGADNLGKKMRKIVEEEQKVVSAYLDFDLKKNKEEFDGLKVYHPDQINLKSYKTIIASYHELEIAKKFIERYNMKYLEDFLFFDHINMIKHKLLHNGFGKTFYDFFKKNETYYQQTLELLSDDRSKEIFKKLINFRLNLFNPEKIELTQLPTTLQEQTVYEEGSNHYIDKLSSKIDESLRRNIAFKISLNPYTYGEKIKLSDKKVIINLGAYNNTSVMFSYLAPNSVIYAFEPQSDIHQQNIELAKIYKNIIPVNAGAWEKTKKIAFNIHKNDIGGTTASSISESGNTFVNVYSLDDFVSKEGLLLVDYIKMDIEGAEREALIGARKTIRKFQPDLAISIYHKAEHLFQIPLLIKELNKNYKIYIDHKNFNPTETVCFASVNY